MEIQARAWPGAQNHGIRTFYLTLKCRIIGDTHLQESYPDLTIVLQLYSVICATATAYLFLIGLVYLLLIRLFFFTAPT